MQIDIRLIRQAQSLATHGSISRAAMALGIAQPTLSRSIKELEHRVGLALFTRHPHGVEPTDFGQMFLLQAGLVAAQVADLEREVALAKGLQTGEVSLGAGPYPAEALLPTCLRRFGAAHPSVRVRIQVDATEALARSLRTRAVDLIVGEASVMEGDDAFEMIARLAPLRGYVFVRTGHPLTRKANVSLADVLEYPFVQIARLPPRVLKPFLDRRQSTRRSGAVPPPFPAIECPTVPLAISAVTDSDAVTMVSLGMARAEMERGRVVPILHEPWMQSDWAIMRLRTRSLGPAAATFVAQLQQAHEQALAEDAMLQQRWQPRAVVGVQPAAPKLRGYRVASSD